MVYNIGMGNERENIIMVAEEILTYLGKPKSLLRFVTDRPGHDRRYAVDSRKLSLLGWRPVVPFEEGCVRRFNGIKNMNLGSA